MLQLGADVTTVDGDTGLPALCLASSLGDVEMCRLFLGCGADPHAPLPDERHKTAITLAKNRHVRDVLASHEPGARARQAASAPRATPPAGGHAC